MEKVIMSKCRSEKFLKRCFGGKGEGERGRGSTTRRRRARAGASQGQREELAGPRVGRFRQDVEEVRGEERRIKDDQDDRARAAKVLVNELDVNQELEAECETFVDERTGVTLDPRMVREACAEEIELMKSIPLYVEASITECWETLGKHPISAQWVDVNTGTGAEQEVRCRLVARDRKPKGEKDREDLFAATSPLEGKKLPLHMAGMQRGATDCVP